MFGKKTHIILFFGFFIFLLGGVVHQANPKFKNTKTEAVSTPQHYTNLNSRNALQLQFQAYTNIHSDFEIKTQSQTPSAPFQLPDHSNVQLGAFDFLTLTKEYQLGSYWATLNLLHQLLPFHGFS